jgi:hypothetical protein
VRERVLQTVLANDGPQLRRDQFDGGTAQCDRGQADPIDVPTPVGRVETPIRQRLMRPFLTTRFIQSARTAIVDFR